MKTVITYGTFDLFHYGHMNLLLGAKKYGDYLVVALSTNEFNKLKNKVCHFDYAKRKKYLETLKIVDLVIPEKNWEQKENDIKKYKADVFVMGNDWKGKFDHLKKICKVVYLPRTKDISSTEIKKIIKLRKKQKK